MGCAESRDSTRIRQFGQDFTLVPYGFRKGEVSNFNLFFPVDKLVADFLGEGKDVSDSTLGAFQDGKFADEGALTEAASRIYTTLNLEHKRISGVTEDLKDNGLFCKYNAETAKADLLAVIAIIEGIHPHFKSAAGVNRAKEDTPVEDKKDDAGEEDKEGGESMEGGSASGKGNICEALISAFTKHPYFADLMKAAVLKRELDSGFETVDFQDYKWSKHALVSTAWTEAAAICAIFLSA